MVIPMEVSLLITLTIQAGGLSALVAFYQIVRDFQSGEKKSRNEDNNNINNKIILSNKHVK